MIKDIKYNGYTAQPSDYESPDGDIAASLNLINEDGALHPIPQPSVILSMPDENHRAVFIHKVGGTIHYIIFNSFTNKLLWTDGKASSPLVEIGSFNGLSHCNAVGNTLLVFTSRGIFYVLWNNSKYNLLGNRLPEVEISFGLVGHPRLYSVSDPSKKTFTVTFEEGIILQGLRDKFSEKNQDSVTEQIMARLNKFIREQTVDKGRFCFPFFIRYALRLYDGSLVHHSAPVLMNPATSAAPAVLWDSAKVEKYHIEDYGDVKRYKSCECDIMLIASSIDCRPIVNDDFLSLGRWSDIVKSVEVFISRPLYTYDQSGKISQLTDTDNLDTRFIGRIFHQGYQHGSQPQYASEITEDSILAPVSATSTSFLDKYMEWPYYQIYGLYFDKNRQFPAESFHLPEFSEEKIGENLRSCSTFYKLCSIPLADLDPSRRTLLPIQDDYLQSLTSREVMTDDYLTHDTLFADRSYSYNNRLNLAAVRRRPFAGFSPLTMFAFCDNAAPSVSVLDDKKTIKVDFQPTVDRSILSVYLKEGGKTFLLQTAADTAPWFSRSQTQKLSWGCFLFYPNVNAFRIVISSPAYGSFSIDLRPHDFLNGAYALLDYASLRQGNLSATLPSVDTTSESLIDASNRIYTSEVNNPFFFPVTGINAVGQGTVLGMATAAKALSQGQFGQFPLYAFTTEGVWAMEVSSTGSYSARQPITRDVILANTDPLQMDSAVLFATDRGIMLISGSQTQCITDVINSTDPFDVMQLPAMDKLHSMLGHGADNCLPTAPFLEFIAECGMLYDYVHQRVIVYNPNYTYAYVFSLKSKEWGMMFSTIEAGINSYPEALAVDHDGALLNFSSMEDEPTKGLLVSRPLKLDAPHTLKTVDTLIQRGRFRKGHVQSVLYGSRDLFNWHLVSSSRDHFLRGFHGTPYKYFRVALLCELAPDETIHGATLQFTPRLTNQPR